MARCKERLPLALDICRATVSIVRRASIEVTVPSSGFSKQSNTYSCFAAMIVCYVALQWIVENKIWWGLIERWGDGVEFWRLFS